MINKMNRTFHAISAVMVSALDSDQKMIDEMEFLANKIYEENFADTKTMRQYSAFIGCLIEIHSKNMEGKIVRKNKNEEGDKTIYKQ